MVAQLLGANGVATTLAADILSGATTLDIATADVEKFLGLNNFPIGLSDGTNSEIARVTGIGGNTISAVGSLASTSGTNHTTLSVSPSALGDLMLATVRVDTDQDGCVVGITGGGCTDWKLIKSWPEGVVGNQTIQMWMGTVSTTGAATLTLTTGFSLAGNTVAITCQEFSSTAGSSALWSVEAVGLNYYPFNSEDPGHNYGNAYYPRTFDPGFDGDLYYALCVAGAALSAGSASGYTYQTPAAGTTQQIAYNPSFAHGTGGAGLVNPTGGARTTKTIQMAVLIKSPTNVWTVERATEPVGGAQVAHGFLAATPTTIKQVVTMGTAGAAALAAAGIQVITGPNTSFGITDDFVNTPLYPGVLGIPKPYVPSQGLAETTECFLAVASGWTSTDWLVVGGSISAIGQVIGAVLGINGQLPGDPSESQLLLVGGGGENGNGGVWITDVEGYDDGGEGVAWVVNGTEHQQKLVVTTDSSKTLTVNGHGDGVTETNAGWSTAVITGGALPTISLTSGVAAQVDTSRDVTLCVETSGAGSLLVEVSPNNSTYTTLFTRTVALTDGVSLFVPKGYYVRLTASGGASLGGGVYY